MINLDMSGNPNESSNTVRIFHLGERLGFELISEDSPCKEIESRHK